MKYLILLFGVVVFSCNNPSHQNYYSQNNILDKTIEIIDSELVKSGSIGIDDTSLLKNPMASGSNTKDYLTICNKLEISFGAIQNDKAIQFIYPFGSCNGDEQFEMIWVPKNKRYTKVNSDSLSFKFKNEKDLGYPSFNIAVFELPKTPVEELEDEFDMGVSFPCEAQIVVRVNDYWYSHGKKTLKSFDDFTKMELEVVNKISDL